MKVIIFLIIFTVMGCAPTGEYTHSQTEIQQEEPLKLSNDPLLDSVYRDRYLKSLKNLSEED
jgi:hypothetical protein